jgi:hypothetical protein
MVVFQRACRVGMVVGLWSGLAACGDNQDPGGAAKLWKEIHTDAYRAWDHAPGYESRQKSHAPHGDAVVIYVNDVVAEALASKTALDAWPDGSIIVKDGFDGSDLDVVAVIEKRGDKWFWAEYDAEGDPSYSGSPELCTSCHARGDDFVRAFPLPEKP